MFKSVFMKYVTVMTVIVFSCFTIMATLMTAFVNSYSDSSRESTVRSLASAVAYYVEQDVSEHDAADRLSTYASGFNGVLDMIYRSGTDTDTIIFIADRDGVPVTMATSGNVAPSSFFASSSARLPDYLSNRLRRGETISGTDNIGGFFANECVYTAIPIYYNQTFFGTVVIAEIRTALDSLMNETTMTLVMTSLWILLAALFVVYIISQKLTKPIRKMNSAAKKMAKGDFSTKIEVKGRDEIAELSKSFNDMARSLANLEKMRSSFISDVSHELRTPMTTIGGFIDSILAGAIPPEKERYYLELVSSEIGRLSRLVSSLLEISRLESGAKKFKSDEFDICEMARRIIISNEQRLEEKNLDVVFECEPERINVFADFDSIYRCFFNICDNAIKFSKEGGRYEVTVKDEGERAVVSVYNEGVGISEEDLPFVFERFYKSDKSRSLDKTGVGLGLFLVKSIIEAHGETIKCESEGGKWCRFTFTLPKKAKETEN